LLKAKQTNRVVINTYSCLNLILITALGSSIAFVQVAVIKHGRTKIFN